MCSASFSDWTQIPVERRRSLDRRIAEMIACMPDSPLEAQYVSDAINRTVWNWVEEDRRDRAARTGDVVPLRLVD